MVRHATTATPTRPASPSTQAGPRFVAPVRYGDHVTASTRVAWVKARTLRVEHHLAVGDPPCAEGFEIRAWVARPETPGGRLRAIPPEAAARLGGRETP